VHSYALLQTSPPISPRAAGGDSCATMVPEQVGTTRSSGTRMPEGIGDITATPGWPREKEDSLMALKFTIPLTQALLDDGLYPATLANIQAREGANGPYLLWRFSIVVDDADNSVSGVTSTKLGPKAKARQWAEALLQRPLQPGEELDLEELIGMRCQVYITTATLDDGSVVNRIDRVVKRSLKVGGKPALMSQPDETDIPF
jgi:hypothetical protein